MKQLKDDLSWSRFVAKWIINDLLRYWKDRSKPCLMSPDYFSSLLYLVREGFITRYEARDIMKRFFDIR